MPFDAFLMDLDRRWLRDSGGGPVRLRVIGSMALMLQADYLRGTKDGDILETASLDEVTRGRLLALGGKGTSLALQHGVYMDIVPAGLPLLPVPALYHSVERLDTVLSNFQVEALDIVDVVVTKLKRFSPSDRKDIEAMANSGLVDPERLVERFRNALDRRSMSADVDDFPLYARRLNQVERDWLFTEETFFDFED